MKTAKEEVRKREKKRRKRRRDERKEEFFTKREKKKKKKEESERDMKEYIKTFTNLKQKDKQATRKYTKALRRDRQIQQVRK